VNSLKFGSLTLISVFHFLLSPKKTACPELASGKQKSSSDSKAYRLNLTCLLPQATSSLSHLIWS